MNPSQWNTAEKFLKHSEPYTDRCLMPWAIDQIKLRNWGTNSYFLRESLLLENSILRRRYNSVIFTVAEWTYFFDKWSHM